MISKRLSVAALLVVGTLSHAAAENTFAQWLRDRTSAIDPIFQRGWIGGGMMASGQTIARPTLASPTITGAAVVSGDIALSNGVRYLNNLALGSSAAAAANTSAINDAIQAMGESGGGTIMLPCGDIYLDGPIDNDVQGVLVKGCGSLNEWSYTAAPVPSLSRHTNIIATTASHVLQHRTPSSPNTSIFSGGGFEDISVDGAGIALDLLHVFDTNDGIYRVAVKNSAGPQAVWFGAGLNGTDCAEVCFLQMAHAYLDIDQRNTAADGLVVTGNANNGASDVGASWFTIRAYTGTGTAINVYDGDNNHFIAMIQNPDVGKPSIILHCQSALYNPGGSFNVFEHVSGADRGIVEEGMDTPGCTAPVRGNKFIYLDGSNAAPNPTEGVGAYSDWFNNNSNSSNFVNAGVAYQFTVGTGANQIQLGGSIGPGQIQLPTLVATYGAFVGRGSNQISIGGTNPGAIAVPTLISTYGMNVTQSGGHTVTIGETRPGSVVATDLVSGGSISVGSSTARGTVATFQNASGTCTHAPGSGSEKVSCSSDARLKSDVADTGSALVWLGDMRVRDFSVTSTAERKTGVIAQELQTTHPDMVQEGSDGLLSVEEPNPWRLVKALQELKAANEKQGAEIDALRREFETYRTAHP